MSETSIWKIPRFGCFRRKGGAELVKARKADLCTQKPVYTCVCKLPISYANLNQPFKIEIPV